MFDGSFAPNFTIGPPVVASLRKASSMFLDCHLAVTVSSGCCRGRIDTLGVVELVHGVLL
jgi:pentose-5-phosphate-3-epimerase